MLILPGTEVEARGLKWHVVSVEQLGPQTLYRLRGATGAVLGDEIDLLSPFEAVSPVTTEMDPEHAAPLANWLVYHQSFLLDQALGPGSLTVHQPGRLRLEPYQLVPVVRALGMSRPRLLLADGVGLGKTIQAGLILTELMARRLAHRVLIVSPAGPLLQQWRAEMLERFGLRLEVLDRAQLEQVRRGNERGDNPFDHVALGLTSIDFMKQERVLEQLKLATYDVIVIDEAHHCMDLGDAQQPEDSQRRRLATVLARQCDALLLLTATPHDGNDRSFASLLELLDPSLVDSVGAVRGTRFRPHVVRRLKPHIKDPVTGQPKFRERRTSPCAVVATEQQHPAFVELQRRLMQLIAPELRRAIRSRHYDDVLAFLALLKRSVSTAHACRLTLLAVGDRLERVLQEKQEEQESRRQAIGSVRDLRRKLARFGTLSVEEEEELAALEVEDMARYLASMQRQTTSATRDVNRRAQVTEELRHLADLAERAQGEDPKLMQLVELIRAIRRETPRANVLVYTEYGASQVAASASLQRAKIGPVLTLSGADSEAAREDVTSRFRTEENTVLVSTDAAAEGLNLHQRCHHLLHLELPWNPNRLEQRNGRIDRYGQEYDPVVQYLFLRGTFEERILLRLIAKFERQRRMLTFVPNTLGVTVSGDASSVRLLSGLANEDRRAITDQGTLLDFEHPEEDDPDDPAVRDLLEEIERSLRSYSQAAANNAWLGADGVNAEESRVQEAEAARVRGDAAEAVDLFQFVLDAIRLDGGDCDTEGSITTAELPPQWRFGLDDMPGYDAQGFRMRLTTDLECTRDSKGRSVGYLGRSHPLAQRALDRVRSLQFGGDAGQSLDRRVSAVRAPVPEPQLLLTYLGRVRSDAGREFEQVLAVTIAATGDAQVLTAPAEWLTLADRDRALRTRGVWEQHFAAWPEARREVAQRAAREAFSPLAQEFTGQHRANLEAERTRHQEWLRERAQAILDEQPVSEQLTLDSAAPARSTRAAAGTPEEQLAALSGDRAASPRQRAEAETVLRLYQQRLRDLEARLQMAEPEVVPLGMLMLVPEDGHGA